MKRIGNLYAQICSLDNLRLGDARASRGKASQPAVQAHIARREANLEALHQMLTEERFTTSPYTVFTIYEPKERIIFRLPYFPDRIVHHAVMNVLERYLVAHFTADTYACIRGRGIHGAVHAMRRALVDEEATRFCLKLDIRKFYPSVHHDTLKEQLRRKFKDRALLRLLDNVIDSAEGLPIGNLLSQYLANFYLSPFDHWLKEQRGVRYYFRYADDIVMLGADKPSLHALRADITDYLADQLQLSVKANHQLFPVASRGIDFLGYRFYHTHTLLRKRLKQRFARALARRRGQATIAAYTGWAGHCNSRHLLKTLLTNP